MYTTQYRSLTKYAVKTKIIQVTVRNAYGADLVYPLCENGINFAMIAGTKTLTQHTINRAKDLGYTFEVIQPAPPVI